MMRKEIGVIGGRGHESKNAGDLQKLENAGRQILTQKSADTLTVAQ